VIDAESLTERGRNLGGFYVSRFSSLGWGDIGGCRALSVLVLTAPVVRPEIAQSALKAETRQVKPVTVPPRVSLLG
jgi:hypothetical protein